MFKNVSHVSLLNTFKRSFCKKVLNLDTIKQLQPNELVQLLKDLKDGYYDGTKPVEILNKYEIKNLTESPPFMIVNRFVNPEEEILPALTHIDEGLFGTYIEQAFEKNKLQSEKSAKRLYMEAKLEGLGESVPAHIPAVNNKIEKTFNEYDKGMEKLKSQAFIEDSFFDNDLFDVSKAIENRNLMPDSFLNAEYNSDDGDINIDVKSIIKETNKAINEIIQNDQLPIYEETKPEEAHDINIEGKSNEFTKYLNNLKQKDSNFIFTKTRFFGGNEEIDLGELFKKLYKYNDRLPDVLKFEKIDNAINIKVKDTIVFKFDENFIKLLKVKITQINPDFITFVNFSKKEGSNGYLVLMLYAETEHLSSLVFDIGDVITKSLLECFNLFIQLALADIIKTYLFKKEGLRFNIVTGKPMKFETVLNKEEKIKSVVFMKGLVKAMVTKLSGGEDINSLQDFNFHSQLRYKNKYFMENLKLVEKLLPGEIIYKI
jgi:hypothetical protein